MTAWLDTLGFIAGTLTTRRVRPPGRAPAPRQARRRPVVVDVRHVHARRRHVARRTGSSLGAAPIIVANVVMLVLATGDPRPQVALPRGPAARQRRKRFPMSEAKKLAFLGLGVMGYPMAGHLARAGHEVTVYNRTPAKAEAWAQRVRRPARRRRPPTPRDGADVVLMCVGNDDDVRAVATGDDGALAGMGRGADPRRPHDGVGRRRARGARGGRGEGRRLPRRAGVGRPGRRARTASSRSWSAATPTPIARAEPVLAHYARAVHAARRPSGAGQLTKMVNQICIAGLVQALAEGIDFATARRARRRARARRDQQGRGAVVADGEPRQDDGSRDKFDFGFAVDWMRKDLGDLPRRGARATARRCRSRRWSISSTARCRRAAAVAGTRRA